VHTRSGFANGGARKLKHNRSGYDPETLSFFYTDNFLSLRYLHYKQISRAQLLSPCVLPNLHARGYRAGPSNAPGSTVLLLRARRRASAEHRSPKPRRRRGRENAPRRVHVTDEVGRLLMRHARLAPNLLQLDVRGLIGSGNSEVPGSSSHTIQFN
jgi:hypothetical protein